MSPQEIIAGNWKMHKTAGEAKKFVNELAPKVRGSRVLLAVPFTALQAAQGTAIEIGAQNMHDAPEGAFTGEISAQMLWDAGATFVILGHSERRHLFGETNGFIHRKVQRAIEEEIQPLLCIGETEEERAHGRTADVLKRQLDECLKDVDLEKMILAYEPVWAIGTGKTATPEIAAEAHHLCRTHMGAQGKGVSILYGGSVKPETMKPLMQQPDVNGVLVGGASLDVETFAKIVNWRK